MFLHFLCCYPLIRLSGHITVKSCTIKVAKTISITHMKQTPFSLNNETPGQFSTMKISYLHVRKISWKPWTLSSWGSSSKCVPSFLFSMISGNTIFAFPFLHRECISARDQRDMQVSELNFFFSFSFMKKKCSVHVRFRQLFMYLKMNVLLVWLSLVYSISDVCLRLSLLWWKYTVFSCQSFFLYPFKNRLL